MRNLADLRVVRTEEFLTADLPTGQIRLSVHSCMGRVEDILGFAARANPKRAFLFLSKVLGKHYPVKPSVMASIHALLAEQVPYESGPVIFVGMAETATGLGQGVFEAWKQTHPETQAVYLHTTRYRVNGAEPLLFEESHSHAPRVFLHLPSDTQMRAISDTARHVVLIDDELSTGNTFINLTRVIRATLPLIQGVHIATIADFMGEARRAELTRIMGIPCTIGSILSGEWEFTSNGATMALHAAQCDVGQDICLEDSGHGRLGRTSLLSVPDSLLDALSKESVHGTTLVLGTGEFMHAAFVLGRELEARGVDVRVQATTRSPILRWGAVQHVMSVPDTYGEGLPNYLYNFNHGQYARVLICHELPTTQHHIDLSNVLKGRPIQFLTEDNAQEIPLR